MKLLKKIAIGVLAVGLAIPTAVSTHVEASTPFKDIKATDYEITYLHSKGLITGTSSTTFSPLDIVTREQAAAIIGRALNLNGTERKTAFPDVSSTSYASGYIDAAHKAGIISGYPDGTFKPKQTMTRGEMAYLLSRAFNLKSTVPTAFKDIPYSTDSGSLYVAVNKIAVNGITNGTGNGNYSPTNNLIRREFAIFVARAINSDFKVAYESSAITSLYATADGLNVRRGPSTSHASVGKINKGTEFKVYGYDNGWAYGVANGLTGYVSLPFLHVIPKASVQRILAVDAGHGGNDPGAVSNGLREKDVNLDVALRVESKLKSRGVQILMTRRNDSALSLDYRAAYGIQNGADAFVSIHANATLSTGVSGSETFYAASLDPRAVHSKKMAEFIQARLYKAMNHTNRGVKEAEFRVIAQNSLPATLVELGFLTNATDAAKLKDPVYLDRSAQAIADGIIDYYNWRDGK